MTIGAQRLITAGAIRWCPPNNASRWTHPRSFLVYPGRMIDPHASRELFTIEQFVTLSAKINYQLSALALKKSVLLSLALGPTDVRDRDQRVLVDALERAAIGVCGRPAGVWEPPGCSIPFGRPPCSPTRCVSQP